ncbi:MAG: hypothetical protein OEZ00_01150, partial [Dehalococcoidia bacterium]|nr:hypothetical protein [Dehalococcoidia bacterium]
ERIGLGRKIPPMFRRLCAMVAFCHMPNVTNNFLRLHGEWSNPDNLPPPPGYPISSPEPPHSADDDSAN